jgi:hypothetical protein
MSVNNAATSSVMVTIADIHRLRRRGCKTLIAGNDIKMQGFSFGLFRRNPTGAGEERD